MNILGAFVLAPLVIGLFLALPDVARRLLRRLREDGIIENTLPKDLRTLVREFGWLNHRILVVSAAALAVLYFANALLIGHQDVDDFPSGILILVTAVLQAIVVYLGIIAVLRLAIMTQAMGKLLRGPWVHVQPLHPDGCGGMWIVGRLFTVTLNVGTVFGAVAVCFILLWNDTPVVMGRRPELYLLAAFYLGLLPLAFLNLLWRPHERLEAYRSDVLKPLAHVFKARMLAAWPSQTDHADQLKLKTDSLAEIARQHRMLNELCPVWPLRIARLRAVMVAAVLPLLGALVTALFGVWTR